MRIQPYTYCLSLYVLFSVVLSAGAWAGETLRDNPTEFPVPVNPYIVGPKVDESALCGGVDLPPTFLRAVAAELSEVAAMAQVIGTVVVEAHISAYGEVRNVRIVESIHPIVDKPALDACLASRFNPAQVDCEPIAGVVRVGYDFEKQELVPYPYNYIPSDAELARNSGLFLPADLVDFISSADEVEVFEICLPSNPKHRERMISEETEQIEFQTDGDTYFERLQIFKGVELSIQQVEIVRELLVKHSPYWSSAEHPMLPFRGATYGHHYGVSIKGEHDVVYVLLGFSAASNIVIGSKDRYFGRGHPYRESSERWVSLVQDVLGRDCSYLKW